MMTMAFESAWLSLPSNFKTGKDTQKASIARASPRGPGRRRSDALGRYGRTRLPANNGHPTLSVKEGLGSHRLKTLAANQATRDALRHHALQNLSQGVTLAKWFRRAQIRPRIAIRAQIGHVNDSCVLGPLTARRSARSPRRYSPRLPLRRQCRPCRQLCHPS
jgi:hypothetical protein